MESQARLRYKTCVGHNITSLTMITGILLENLRSLGFSQEPIWKMEKIANNLKEIHKSVIDEWNMNLDDNTYDSLCHHRLAEMNLASEELLAIIENSTQLALSDSEDIQTSIDGLKQICSHILFLYTESE